VREVLRVTAVHLASCGRGYGRMWPHRMCGRSEVVALAREVLRVTGRCAAQIVVGQNAAEVEWLR
jgi:hypothetical protein